MSDAPEQPWPEFIQWSKDHGLLAKTLYVVNSKPTGGLGPVMAALEPHVKYQTRMELEGVMFAAGPLASDDLSEWLGEGLFIYRASSMAEARKYAEEDPMHIAGARSFTIREWLLNEGTFSVQLFYSGGAPKIT